MEIVEREMSPYVRAAILSGHVPTLRNWRDLPFEELTLGERVCFFIEQYVYVPEGDLVGQPMQLLEFQEVFILSIFDGPRRARRAILSVGRKAGKTAMTAALMIVFMFMRELIKPFSRVNSAALSRDQAALVFNYMSKSLQQSPEMQGRFRIVPSGKRIVALRTGIEYHALAADAGTSMGLSPAVLVGDEWGQIVGPTHPFVDALLTSQGAHSEPLAIMISTQAADDGSFLSIAIDDAARAPSDEVVCHLYVSPKELPIDDPDGWTMACPALGTFRSIEDVRMQAEQAKRLPSAQASFENLILNRRVALSNLWLAPTVWKECSGEPQLEAFQTSNSVALGLDLSARNDLTAAVYAVKDDYGVVHLLPFCFTPELGLYERETRDKAPYTQWVKEGKLIAVPGAVINYEWVVEFLKQQSEEAGIHVATVQFDRWRINELKRAADRIGFAQEAVWQEVGQGYASFSPRIEHFETYLLEGNVRHGSHPLMNMAASGAIVVRDPANNRKIDKSKTTVKIDALVAAVMAVGAFMHFQEVDVAAMIG